MMKTSLITMAVVALTIVQIAYSQEQDGKVFGQATDNVNGMTSEANKAVLALMRNMNPGKVYLFLLDINARYFVRDLAGRRNPKADARAFSAAVTNITPAMLAHAAALISETKGVPSTTEGRKGLAGTSQESAMFVIATASRAFIQPSGTFNGQGLRTAVLTLDKSDIAMANALFKSDPQYSLFILLHVAATTADAKGQIQCALLKKTLDSVRADEITGKTDQELVDSFASHLRTK